MRWRLLPPITRPTSRVSFLVHRGARGVSAPRAEVLLFRQKDPKPWAPGRGPRGVPLPRSRLLGLRNSLRSDSPRPQTRVGTGAQPRPQAPWKWRHEMPRVRLQQTKALNAPSPCPLPEGGGGKRHGRARLRRQNLRRRICQVKLRRRPALSGTSAALSVTCRAAGESGEAALFPRW